MRKFAFALSFFVLAGGCTSTQNEIIELTNDGTWCWFSDPRAIITNAGEETLVTGFVKEDGSIAALQYSLSSGKKSEAILYEKLEVDDHNNPAFVQRPDGHYLAFFTKHHNTDLYMCVSKNPADATQWGKPMAINPNGKDAQEKYGDSKYTYANPHILREEANRIYLFGRWVGFKPNVSWSDDGGITWAESRVVVCPQPYSWGERPYVKYFSNGKDKIHMVFTDGHPRDEPTNSVYYACYCNGAFYRSNGEKICTLDELPFEPRDASIVYDATETGNRAWVYDIVADNNGKPCVAYARYPNEENHIYHYAYFDGETWQDTEMVNSGKWFPHTPEGEFEREPHYSGGMAIDPLNPAALYISREINGIFEIEKWVFSKTDEEPWTISPVTQNSTNDQVRPVVAQAAGTSSKTVVLWNAISHYVHYTDYRTDVKMYVD